MRILLLLSVVAGTSAMAASAQAADLSRPVPVTKAPSYVPPPLTWTGFYAGAHLGVAWSDADWTNPVSGLGNSFASGGLLGGGQIGYNYQAGAVVWGVEGDFSGTSLRPSNTDVAGFTHSTNTYWTSTVTGRLGFTFDRALFYTKGGAAFADERNSVVDPSGLFSSSGTATAAGWTAGGGVEYALDPRWSAKIEYDYLGFGSQSVSAALPGGAPGSVDLNIQRVIVGINHRF